MSSWRMTHNLTDMEPWKTNLQPSKLTRSCTGWLWVVQVVTGDSQEEVLIFRDKQTLHHNIYIIINTIIVIISILPDGEGGDQVRADKRGARSPRPTWHDCEGTTRWKIWEVDQPYETVEVPPGDKILESFWNCMENLEIGPHGRHESEGTTTWQDKTSETHQPQVAVKNTFHNLSRHQFRRCRFFSDCCILYSTFLV